MSSILPVRLIKKTRPDILTWHCTGCTVLYRAKVNVNYNNCPHIIETNLDRLKSLKGSKQNWFEESSNLPYVKIYRILLTDVDLLSKQIFVETPLGLSLSVFCLSHKINCQLCQETKTKQLAASGTLTSWEPFRNPLYLINMKI